MALIDMNKINAAANVGPTVKNASTSPSTGNQVLTLNSPATRQNKRFTLLDSLKIQRAATSPVKAPATPSFSTPATGLQTLLNNSPVFALPADTTELQSGTTPIQRAGLAAESGVQSAGSGLLGAIETGVQLLANKTNGGKPVKILNPFSMTASDIKRVSEENQQKAKAGVGKVGGIALDAINSVANMGATALASAAAGIPFVAGMGVTAGGNAALTAKEQGKTVEQQALYGLTSGLAEAAVESISGIGASKALQAAAGRGVSALLAKLPAGVASWLSKVGTSTAAKILGDAVGEASEEFVQYDIDRVLQKITLGNDVPRDIREQAYQALVGGVTGGVFGVGGTVLGANANATGNPPTSTSQEPAPVYNTTTSTPAHLQQGFTYNEYSDVVTGVKDDKPVTEKIKNIKVGEDAGGSAVYKSSEKAPAQPESVAAFAPQVEAKPVNIIEDAVVEKAQAEPTAVTAPQSSGDIASALQIGDTITLPTGLSGKVTERTADSISFEFSNGGKASAKLDGSEGSAILNRINSGEIQVQKAGQNPSMGAAPTATNGLPEGMGAMSNPYPYEQKQSNVGRKTFSRMYWDVLDQLESDGANLTDLSYDVATEKQSIERAQQRLTTDLGGEMQDLPTKQSWSGEDLDTAMGIMDKLTYEAAETHDYTEVNKWAKLIQEKGTNAGQFIQAFAKYNRTPESAVIRAASTLNGLNLGEAKKTQILDAVSNNAGRIVSAKDGDTASMLQVIHDLAKERNTVSWRTKDIGKLTNSILSELDFSTLKQIATAQLNSVATDYVKPSFGKRISTYQVLSHLSSVGTFLRNSIGNTTFDIADTISNDLSVPVDAFLGQFTGKRTVGVEKSWLSTQKRTEALKAAKQSLAEVMLDIDTEGAETRYGTTTRRTNKMVGGPLDRFFSRWEGLLSLSLNVTDEFSKGGIRGEAVESLQKFVENGQLTQDEVNAIAQNEALYRTFQDKTKLGGTLSAAKDALNQWGFGDSGRTLRNGKSVKDFGVGDILVKYPGVPGALVTRAAEYSPAGAVRGGIQLMEALKSSKSGTLDAVQQRAIATSIGRGINGSILIGLFWALAKAGVMKRADDEKDADVAALNSSEGLIGTQLNVDAALRGLKGGSAAWVKGDTLVSIGFLQPINSAMTIGALAADAPEMNFATAASSTITGLLESASDLSMIQNISTITKGFLYGNAEEIPGQLIQSTASGFVPAPIRQAAKATDNLYRDAYGSFGDSLKNSIPFLRETLPSKLTPFGEDKTYTDNTGLNIANALFLPGAVNTYKPTGISDELSALRKVTKDTGVYPNRKPPSDFVKDHNLTQDQQHDFQQTYGKTAYTTVTGLMSESQYNTLSDTEKAAAVQQAYSYSLQIAKAEISDYTPEKWVLQAQDMTEGERAEYMLFRAVWSSQGEGAKKADQVKAVTSGHDFSDAILSTTMSEAQEKNYNQYAKGTVGVETYLLASSFYNSATTDKDANGKPIKGKGATDKTLSYIDGLSLTRAQKRALAESVGIAEKTANHKWPKYMD